jgi:hypothetical protein
VHSSPLQQCAPHHLSSAHRTPLSHPSPPIPTPQANKREYVDLVARHRMTTSIKPQLKSFLEGFWELVPRHLIAIFTDHELELLISGLPDIDVADLKAHSEYHGGYSASSPAVRWFWEVRGWRGWSWAGTAGAGLALLELGWQCGTCSGHIDIAKWLHRAASRCCCCQLACQGSFGARAAICCAARCLQARRHLRPPCRTGRAAHDAPLASRLHSCKTPPADALPAASRRPCRWSRSWTSRTWRSCCSL